jgi:hypothetical protein
MTFVSFFNKLSTEKRNYAHELFLTMASKRIMLWKETMSWDKTRSWLLRDLQNSVMSWLPRDGTKLGHGFPVPTKIPSDIPKFEGKNGEDPGDHFTTFHLWCSSNSLSDDSIRLRLFQRTFIGVAGKWYIRLPRGEYGTFNQLVMVFLNHFEFPIHYDVGLELLSTLRQDIATHILDHIQEWCRWKKLIKTPSTPNLSIRMVF